MPRRFGFLGGKVLPEDNLALEFYDYLVHCQIFRGVIEFSLSLVPCQRQSLVFLFGHILRFHQVYVYWLQNTENVICKDPSLVVVSPKTEFVTV